MSDLIKPDLTRRANYPIFGDTLTFKKGEGTQAKQYVGIVSEWNVAGTQVWEVEVEVTKKKMHVYGCEISHIERTGEIPECPVAYNPKNDPDLQNL